MSSSSSSHAQTSSLQESTSNSNSNSNLSPENRDCLACRIIGTGALGGVGLYALNQSRSGKAGSPAARRVLALVGVLFLGLGWGRWNMGRKAKMETETERLVASS